MIYLIQELLNHISTLQNVLIFTLLLVLEHGPQHEEQTQAHPAGAHCVGDGLEPHQPPGQLEDPLDPREPEHRHDAVQYYNSL